MPLLLLLLFVVAPVVELVVIVQIAGSIGVLNTLGLLFIVGVLGGLLVKRQGIGVMRRLQASVDARRPPTRELADGAFLLFAGLLLLLPGFLSDVLALLLLLPPVRALLRGALARGASATSPMVRVVTSFPTGAGFRGRVVDVGGTETPRNRRPGPDGDGDGPDRLGPGA